MHRKRPKNTKCFKTAFVEQTNMPDFAEEFRFHLEKCEIEMGDKLEITVYEQNKTKGLIFKLK